MKGPEDTPGWLRYLGDNEGSTVRECRSCGKEIGQWHCADGGCCWCSSCGINAKDIREKRKNGEA